MNSNRAQQSVALVLMVLFFAGAAALVPLVNVQREELQVAVNVDKAQGVPPHIVLATTALGPFRGIAVHALWHRAHELKQAGKYYEANTLSQWITTLQPRFPQVWSFHAWNMAYNISVATHTPDERWSWVNKGINLLRNEGIPLNPKAPRVYRELSWIFFHKIGGFTDDMNWHYKAMLAREFHIILNNLSRGDSTEKAVERFRAIAEAPDTIDELLEKRPDVRPVLDTIRAHGEQPNFDLLRMIGMKMLYTFSIDGMITGESVGRMPKGVNVDLIRAFEADQEQTRILFDALMPHLRKRAFEDHYNMDTSIMLEMMESYGPIDWRHPAAHGAYWAELGGRVSRSVRNQETIDELNMIRQRLYSLQTLMQWGRIDYDGVTNRIDMMPDPRFIDAYEHSLNLAYEQIESKEGLRSVEGNMATKQNFQVGHENFLIRATVYSYLYGEEAKAQEYFTRARELYGDGQTFRAWRYDGTIEDLVITELDQTEDLTADVRQFIDAMVRRGIREGLGRGDMRIFTRFLKLANRIYERRDQYADRKLTAEQARIGFRPFPEVVANSYVQFMKEQTIPALYKARTWAYTPDTLKRMTYIPLQPILLPQIQAEGLDPARAFPMPDGMEEIIAEHERRMAEAEAADGEAGAAGQDAPPISIQRN